MHKPFLVFMCPNCRNFTNAPAGQKRRRCSYCGKIIDIGKASCAVVDGPEQAAAAVKGFNASQGGNEFDLAVERSNEKLRALLPDETIIPTDITSGEDLDLPSGKMQRLLALIEKEATESPVSLDRIADLCPSYQLAWSWVEEQITKLANSGVLIFPRPWTIKLVQLAREENDTSGVSLDISKDIMDLLKQRGGKAKLEEIMQHFQELGIGQSSIESSLNRLMNQGLIFEPKPGFVTLI
ncbi:MAG: hypothetical protein ACFE7R_01165 [Candidatus Hodarchaeota archaeon]